MRHHRSRKAGSRMGTADPEEQTQNWNFHGPINVLQTVYFRLRQHCETAHQTHGLEVSLPVYSRSEGRLSNTKGGPLYRPYSCLSAARRKVSR
jgi:hypothetical protein